MFYPANNAVFGVFIGAYNSCLAKRNNEMIDGTSLINIGELSKPATVLIEKISDAIGGCFKPYQIRRVAQAEAEAEKIKAAAKIEITELQHRALQRFVFEEAKKQNNIESITAKALPKLEENSDPTRVDDDWITNFFDKCRLISDEEMQNLWAKVLAGEANSPGKYSRRTVNLLGSLDKSDAALFTKLCDFGWLIGDVIPIIYKTEAEIYTRHGITFNALKHLDEIGLLSFASVAGYLRTHLPKRIQVFYYGTPINIEFKKENDNDLDTGKVLLSNTGQELALICGSAPIPNFLDYVLEQWSKKGLILFSPYPQKR